MLVHVCCVVCRCACLLVVCVSSHCSLVAMCLGACCSVGCGVLAVRAQWFPIMFGVLACSVLQILFLFRRAAADIQWLCVRRRALLDSQADSWGMFRGSTWLCRIIWLCVSGLWRYSVSSGRAVLVDSCQLNVCDLLAGS